MANSSFFNSLQVDIDDSTVNSFSELAEGIKLTFQRQTAFAANNMHASCINESPYYFKYPFHEYSFPEHYYGDVAR